VKIVNYNVKFNQDVELIDVSLEAKGPEEDDLYISSDYLRKNVRRGNTFINIYKKNKLRQTILARKGLEKFFDLAKEYMLYNLYKIKDLNNIGGVKNKY